MLLALTHGMPDMVLGTHLEFLLERDMFDSNMVGLGHGPVSADSILGTFLRKLRETQWSGMGRDGYTMLLVFFQLSFLIPRNPKSGLHYWFVTLRFKCRYSSCFELHYSNIFCVDSPWKHVSLLNVACTICSEMVSVMFFSTNKEVVGAVTLHEDFIAAV